ncbi:hypothetical protein MXB_4881 [Myxobolus squamalis]|nr:hypothetical protein MXB_4881 [Myxobolus squamalis]
MFPGVGIVGIDDSSTRYIKKFQENCFKINGICGPNTLDLRRVAEDFEINFVTSKVEDLLVHNEINLIVFMPIASNMAEHVCKALTVAGKHVICCQKFAGSSKYAQEMYEASLKYPTLLSVIENPIRFSKNFIAAKNLLLKNTIGQVK